MPTHSALQHPKGEYDMSSFKLYGCNPRKEYGEVFSTIIDKIQFSSFRLRLNLEVLISISLEMM